MARSADQTQIWMSLSLSVRGPKGKHNLSQVAQKEEEEKKKETIIKR